MKICISAESTIDIPNEILNKYKISTIPFQINIGDKSFLDGEISSTQIIEGVKQNKVLPKTSAINVEQYTEYFSALLKNNDAIIHFSLSSELSSSYNNAFVASKDFKNVFIIDTRTLSTGIALLAIYASKLTEKGLNVDEIVNKCLQRVDNIQASFVLMRLDYLYKGGRCSSLTYLGANLLGIRPQIIVKDGKMVVGSKFRGNFISVVDKYCSDILSKFNNYDLDTAFVTYTTGDEQVVNTAVNHLKEVGFKNIYITNAGGTITSHCGENCLGILYINDGGIE